MTRIGNFVDRNYLSARKALWRLTHDYSPQAKAVFILGAQRSGTTLLLECLDRSMRFDVLGESSEAMVKFRIRDDDYIRNKVRSSRHEFVVFKPLTDSHRARDFLSLIPGTRAIWAFRRVQDRVNSSVAKFGDHNLQILAGLSRGEGLERWQAQGLTGADLAFIRTFDYSTMSPHTASALFWYLRNSLYFSMGLQDDPNVLPLAYEDLATRPKETMQSVCGFLAAPFEDAMVDTVHAQSIGREQSHLSPETLALCQPLYDRLYGLQRQRLHELNGG
jgi:hypothetical protein